MRGIFIVIALCALYATAVAATPYQDFQVNSTIDGIEYDPAVTAQQAVDGIYAVAFADQNRDAATGTVRVRLFDNAWNPMGGDFTVNTTPLTTSGPSYQYRPTIDMDASGRFVAAWVKDATDIYARCYTVSGGLATPTGPDFLVAGGLTSSGMQADVGLQRDGSKFVVCYHDGGDVQYKVFPWGSTTASVSGIANTASDCGHGSVAVADDGSFVITYYDDFTQSPSQQSQFFQMFNDSGTTVGMLPEQEVFPGHAATSFSTAAVGMNQAAGEFVITALEQNSPEDAIYYRLYNADGTAKAPAQLAHSSAQLIKPSVSMDDAGNFVLSFTERIDDHDIFTIRYDALGNALDASPVQMNTTIVDSAQAYGGVAVQPDGDFLVVWDDASDPGDGGTTSYGYYSVWAAGVPEPASAVILAISSLALLQRRRR